MSFTLYFGRGVLDGNFAIADFVFFFALLTQVRSRIWMFARFLSDFSRKMIFVEKLWDLFDDTHEIPGYDNGDNFVHGE